MRIAPAGKMMMNAIHMSTPCMVGRGLLIDPTFTAGVVPNDANEVSSGGNWKSGIFGAGTRPYQPV
jgi:hypothetical protein